MKTFTNIEVKNECLHSRRVFMQHADCTWLRTSVYTGFAMLAFASNSILCRMALAQDTIDPAGFTAIRLVSGALTLLLLTIRGTVKRNGAEKTAGSWISAAMLFLYAITFSFAFVRLTAGTGALILFGAVQITMIMTAIFRREHPGLLEYIGLAAAMAGLIYLVFPGLQAPSLTGAVLMAAAGTAWGVYTLRGRGAVHAAAATADNFRRSVPLILIVGLFFIKDLHITSRGVLLAAISGGLASAMGYVVWYAALPNLSTTRAALVQLIVPVLASAGGILVLSEPLTIRLVISAVVILGGIALSIFSRRQISPARGILKGG